MIVLRNRTQTNFTMISNNILRDSKLKMIDRGVLCTLCGLPDGWNFSVAGICAIVPDGETAINNSLKRLEAYGYLKRTTDHGKTGKFETEIEIFVEKKREEDEPLSSHHDGKTVTDHPTQEIRHGKSVTEKQPQYNTDNKNKKIKKEEDKSIYQSTQADVNDDRRTNDSLKMVVADNIRLDWLLGAASNHGDDEVNMVHNIYDVICDMVCYPRDVVQIKGTTYPWENVKSQFLKLRYEHIADILNRIVDADLEIKNMSAYLVSTLYTASLVGTIEAQAHLHDDYLRFLRGNPYPR